MTEKDPIEAWGVENSEGIYVLDEESAREVSEGNEDQRLVCKVSGAWVYVND